jgi:HPt (histidine-containing phosphotransfer) domain-containing protein
LFVDDEAISRMLLSTHLAEAGYIVQDADSGKKPLQRLRAAHTLKSDAKNFGGSELARLIQELENRAKENNLEGAEELLVSIGDEYAEVHAALETIRKTLT